MPLSHPIHRVRGFEIVGPHVLRLSFEDGVVRTIDFGPVLEGELYGPLRDPNVFNRVRIDPEAHTALAERGGLQPRNVA